MQAINMRQLSASLAIGLASAWLLLVGLSFYPPLGFEIAKAVGPLSMWILLPLIASGFGLLAFGVAQIRTEDIPSSVFCLGICALLALMALLLPVSELSGSKVKNAGVLNLHRMSLIEGMVKRQPSSAQDEVSMVAKKALALPTQDNIHAAHLLVKEAWKRDRYQNALTMLSVLDMTKHALARDAVARGWMSSTEMAALKNHLLKVGPPKERMQQEAWLRLVGNVPIQEPIDLGTSREE